MACALCDRISLSPSPPAAPVRAGAGAPPRRVLVGHQSALMRVGLAELMSQLQGVQLCASTSDAHQTVHEARRQRPDLLVLAADLHIAVRAQIPPARVLLVSPHPHPCGRCRDGDVCGFSSEREPLESLRQALRTALDCREATGSASTCSRCPLKSTLLPAPLPLSRRELEVFELIALGRLTGGIARSLDISIKTVETYRGNIKRKLGLEDSAALTEAALLWHHGIGLPAVAARRPRPRRSAEATTTQPA